MRLARALLSETAKNTESSSSSVSFINNFEC
ncbi:hypothetical protein CBNA_1166 [Coxiella burnetii str. Namibia]|nr:hypothetical protein CBNA_1166 [Coxiella burnetii str. Namibia]